MIGLGRMGANLTRRLMRDGHEVVVCDINAHPVRQLESEGAVGARSLEEFVARLDAPWTAWIMVSAGFVQETADRLAELLDVGDVTIDGGNSYHRDDIDRWRALAPKDIPFVDVGTSGGVFGLERGLCLMIGGEDEVAERLDGIFATIAPGVDGAPRTPTKEGGPVSTAENGYLHCAPGGYSGRVSDSGEGRWTVAAAVDVGVPANVLTTALYERFSSRGEADFGDQLLSAMRNKVGGHVEQAAAGAR